MPYVKTYVKPDYPPLLPLGWHKHTLPELRVRCVDAFPLSSTRDRIMTCLEHITGVLSDAGMKGKLWVNGSFLTNKIDPDDSDVVLCMKSDFADNMTPEQQEVDRWFADVNGNLYQWLKCHTFSITRWPEGHPNFEVGEWNYAYWLRQWGFSRADLPKGIAVVELL